jgi:hypothetical protein
VSDIDGLYVAADGIISHETKVIDNDRERCRIKVFCFTIAVLFVAVSIILHGLEVINTLDEERSTPSSRPLRVHQPAQALVDRGAIHKKVVVVPNVDGMAEIALQWTEMIDAEVAEEAGLDRVLVIVWISTLVVNCVPDEPWLALSSTEEDPAAVSRARTLDATELIEGLAKHLVYRPSLLLTVNGTVVRIVAATTTH